jgi:hypothetical protein
MTTYLPILLQYNKHKTNEPNYKIVAKNLQDHFAKISNAFNNSEIKESMLRSQGKCLCAYYTPSFNVHNYYSFDTIKLLKATYQALFGFHFIWYYYIWRTTRAFIALELLNMKHEITNIFAKYGLTRNMYIVNQHKKTNYFSIPSKIRAYASLRLRWLLNYINVKHFFEFFGEQRGHFPTDLPEYLDAYDFAKLANQQYSSPLIATEILCIRLIENIDKTINPAITLQFCLPGSYREAWLILRHRLLVRLLKQRNFFRYKTPKETLFHAINFRSRLSDSEFKQAQKQKRFNHLVIIYRTYLLNALLPLNFSQNISKDTYIDLIKYSNRKRQTPLALDPETSLLRHRLSRVHKTKYLYRLTAVPIASEVSKHWLPWIS